MGIEAHFTRHAMAERQVVLVFISTLLFAAAQAEGGNTEDGQEVDIRKFLQENQKIIVYQATDGGNKTCVADYYSDVKNTEAVFERYYTDGARRSSFLLRGVFGSTKEGPEARPTKMSVFFSRTGTDGTLFSQETMLYFSSAGNCGVFNVTDYTGESWLDVRIKYGSVNLEHKFCLKFYSDILGKATSRRVYEEGCPPVTSNSNQ
uniref:Putative lipocalin-3 1 n=1 Tax=Amblyomma americanum TaxID=6943 RepID=A0A0C9SFF6_AMBAM